MISHLTAGIRYYRAGRIAARELPTVRSKIWKGFFLSLLLLLLVGSVIGGLLFFVIFAPMQTYISGRLPEWAAWIGGTVAALAGIALGVVGLVASLRFTVVILGFFFESAVGEIVQHFRPESKPGQGRTVDHLRNRPRSILFLHHDFAAAYPRRRVVHRRHVFELARRKGATRATSKCVDGSRLAARTAQPPGLPQFRRRRIVVDPDSDCRLAHTSLGNDSHGDRPSMVVRIRAVSRCVARVDYHRAASFTIRISRRPYRRFLRPVLAGTPAVICANIFMPSASQAFQ